MSAATLRGALACAVLATVLGSPPVIAAQSAPAPNALLDAAWNAADWPTVLTILDAMGESDQVQARAHRAHLNYAWELLAAGDCPTAHTQFERALGLTPGDPAALHGLVLARQRCPEAIAETPAPRPTHITPVAGGQPPRATPPPAAAITPQPVSEPTAYTVQRGDTLFSLARRYGLTVVELQRANGLADDEIRAGQVLTIPPPSSDAAPEPDAPSGPGLTLHLVQPGETLYSIARRYGSTLLAIQAANSLADTDIWAGQRLVIPPSSGGGETGARMHRVSPGETLYSLAARYGVTVQALQAANGLRDEDIVAGTLLVIP
jgi:LysM repeat protein